LSYLSAINVPLGYGGFIFVISFKALTTEGRKEGRKSGFSSLWGCNPLHGARSRFRDSYYSEDERTYSFYSCLAQLFDIRLTMSFPCSCVVLYQLVIRCLVRILDNRPACISQLSLDLWTEASGLSSMHYLRNMYQ